MLFRSHTRSSGLWNAAHKVMLRAFRLLELYATPVRNMQTDSVKDAAVTAVMFICRSVFVQLFAYIVGQVIVQSVAF